MENPQGDWKVFLQDACSTILGDTGNLRQQCMDGVFQIIRDESAKIETNIVDMLETKLLNDMKKTEGKIQDYVIHQMEKIQKSGEATQQSASSEIINGLSDVLERSVEAVRKEEKKVAADRIRELQSEFQNQIRKIKQDAIEEIKDYEAKMRSYSQIAVVAAREEKAKIRETMKDRELQFTQLKHKLEADILTMETKLSQLNQRVEELARENEKLEEKRNFLRKDLHNFFDLAYKASDHSLISSKPSVTEDDKFRTSA